MVGWLSCSAMEEGAPIRLLPRVLLGNFAVAELNLDETGHRVNNSFRVQGEEQTAVHCTNSRGALIRFLSAMRSAVGTRGRRSSHVLVKRTQCCVVAYEINSAARNLVRYWIQRDGTLRARACARTRDTAISNRHSCHSML